MCNHDANVLHPQVHSVWIEAHEEHVPAYIKKHGQMIGGDDSSHNVCLTCLCFWQMYVQDERDFCMFFDERVLCERVLCERVLCE